MITAVNCLIQPRFAIGWHLFRTYLNAGITQPNTPLTQLPLIAGKEEELILTEWNNTAQPYDPTPLPQQISQQASKTADQIAVQADDGELTYAQLDARSNQLAHYVIEQGVNAGNRVGICLDRKTDLLVGLLAIWKAGGAYVPLDPNYPSERLAYMLADSEATALITQTDYQANFGDFAGNSLGIDQFSFDQYADTPPDIQLAGNDLAYIIYTSGSTGKPKGVQIQHGALANYSASTIQQLEMNAGTICLATTSTSFDISGTEIYLPLLVGGKVVLASKEAAVNSLLMMELLTESKANMMQATPSHWNSLLLAGWQAPSQMTVLSAGEPLSRQLANQLGESSAQLWNYYGPSETTTYSTGYQVQMDEKPIHIGKPIANTQLYILDEQMSPVPVGVPGELYIGGDGVSPGYLDRAELTAERFVSNPFAGNRQLYRTGDLVKWLPDGNIFYLGRIDHQVKIKGVRIELGEVEATLSQSSTVGKLCSSSRHG